MPARPTFATLCRLEPRLQMMEDSVLAEERRLSYCRVRTWNKDYREAVHALVGPGRKDAHPVLSTQQALDIASTHLFGRLPECGRATCGC